MLVGLMKIYITKPNIYDYKVLICRSFSKYARLFRSHL